MACSQRRRSASQRTTKRYERAQPGALLHIDTMQLPKFARPGHWATGGQRSEQIRNRGAGTVYVVSVVDEHSRLAYCEFHGAEDRRTTTATDPDGPSAQSERPGTPVLQRLGAAHNGQWRHGGVYARAVD
jgi:hypothetical protein